MPLKNTKGNLDRLEKLLNEAGYVLRFEKGNFNSGYCILEHRKVVVINKFLDQEGRINVLSDLLPNLTIDTNRLSVESKNCFKMILNEANRNDLIHQMIEQEISSEEIKDDSAPNKKEKE